ncbi:MAG: hypothetical protein D0433_09255 [Candidatus Thermochlorobacter aerophilum]|uniref:Uncharacterized protein n=1 Tax=Candidatus Thermochlorobacter aerophilus TaxID=1868324 RepID=A0A395LZ69_9BACT|nr:MAG: hypothetical protein D0433_09255 [Candidatus Thermochlorobacter aerophilum]
MTKLQIYKGKDSKIKEKPPEFSRESLLLPQRLNLSKLRRKLTKSKKPPANMRCACHSACDAEQRAQRQLQSSERKMI